MTAKFSYYNLTILSGLATTMNSIAGVQTKNSRGQNSTFRETFELT